MLNFSMIRKQLSAFSLLEMSLVLAIMGTIAGLSMPLLLEQKSIQQRQHTRDRIEVVLVALGTYAATYHTLPCPASKTSHGESISCRKGDVQGGLGFVPYKALGLQESFGKDAYGQNLNYAIDPLLSSREDFERSSETGLMVRGADGAFVLGTHEDPDGSKDPLAVVVFSSGGALGGEGEGERINLAQDLSFVDLPFSSNDQAPFRHLVRWSTRNNLLTYYGKSSPIIRKIADPVSENSPPVAGGDDTESAGMNAPDHMTDDFGL